MENISKKFRLIIFSKERKYLKKINFTNKKIFFFHSAKKYIQNLMLLKKYNVNCFIEYDIKNLIFHFIAKQIFKYDLIVIWAGLGSLYNKKGYYNFFEKKILQILFSRVNKTIFINPYDQKTAKKYKIIQTSYLIPTEGYQLNFKRKIKIQRKKKYRFVMACRPIIEKGILEYISAARKMKNHLFYLYLVGNDKNKIFYNSKKINIYQYKLPNNLVIKNQVNNFEKEIAKYDCLISCSYGEGFGNTLAEATCAALPIISTKTNGSKFIFNRNSLLWIKPKSLKSLIFKINIFLKMKNAQKVKMTQSARNDLKKIDHHNVNTILTKIIGINE